MTGKHCIKTWCSTQGALALSSAEAEYYSMMEGDIRGEGLQNMGRELGLRGMGEELELKVEDKKGTEGLGIFVDSSAAKGFASKRGVGKIRHMEVKWLWLQEEVRRQMVRISKVLGTQNPSDLLPKFMRRGDIEDRLERMNLKLNWAEGRKEKEVAGVRRRRCREERRSDSGDGGSSSREQIPRSWGPYQRRTPRKLAMPPPPAWRRCPIEVGLSSRVRV